MELMLQEQDRHRSKRQRTLSVCAQRAPRPRDCGEQRAMTNSAHCLRAQAPGTLTISELLQIIQAELHTPEQLA